MRATAVGSSMGATVRTAVGGSMRTAIRTVARMHVTPVLAVAVPRTVVIVVVPVAAEHERNDRDADLHAVGGHEDAAALVFFLQIVRGNPAAVHAGRDVAPRPAVDAALDADRRAGAQSDNARITRIRPGAQGHVRDQIALTGKRRCGCKRGTAQYRSEKYTFHLPALFEPGSGIQGR